MKSQDQIEELKRGHELREEDFARLLEEERAKSQKLYGLIESQRVKAQEQMENLARMRRSSQVETR